MKKEQIKETVIATNGKAYHIDRKTGTAQKVFNSLSELKTIKKELAENSRISFNAYLSFVRTEISSEPIKVDKNTFTVKGFKFIFHSDHIECRDILNFGLPVKFEALPTPREMVEFLKNEKADKRKFSPAEMGLAAERGKKLLEEKKTVEVKVLAKVDNSETLEEAKAKALRLIGRIKKKQSSSDKMFTDIPGMIKYRPLQTSIGILVAYYHKKTIRWAQFVDRVEAVIRKETFVRKPVKDAKAEKFEGVDVMTYKKVENFDVIAQNIIVDDKPREAGEFFARYILQKDNAPEAMPQMMKWLRKEITDVEFIDEPVKKDKTAVYDCKLLKGLSVKQVEVLYDVLYTLQILDPTKMVYNEDKMYKVGQKVMVYSAELGYMEEGVVASVTQGVWVLFDKEEAPLINSQKVKIIK